MALLVRNFPSGQHAVLRMNFPLVSKEYSFFPLSTSKMLNFPIWIPMARYWESGEKAKVHASTGPASIDFICLLFSNCQRIWASGEWVAAMVRVWLKSTDETLGWWLSRFHCRSSFLSHHFQTFTWSSRVLWPLCQSLLCLTLRQLTRWHHHGCALVWREYCTGWPFP